jgi:hypothetical protein
MAGVFFYEEEFYIFNKLSFVCDQHVLGFRCSHTIFLKYLITRIEHVCFQRNIFVLLLQSAMF